MIDISHIHPMLVHFPIVLLIFAVAIDAAVLLRGGDLAGAQALSRVGMSALVLGALAAIAAASFGDIALDEAVSKGFTKAPLDNHEDMGMAAMWVFLGLAAIRLVAWRRHFPLTGKRGWILLAAGVAGVAVLLTAAYYGGDLVYRLGVNVAPVKPGA